MSFPLLLLVSLIAGLVGAMTGMGGGVVLIPALTFFGMDIKRAIAISIVSVIATSSGSASAYVRDHITNLKVGMFLEMFTILGALAGAGITVSASERPLYLLFGIVLLASWAALWAERGTPWKPVTHQDDLSRWLELEGSYDDRATGEHVVYRATRAYAGGPLMFGAGMVAGLLGIGAGALKVVIHDLVMGLPPKVSTHEQPDHRGHGAGGHERLPRDRPDRPRSGGAGDPRGHGRGVPRHPRPRPPDQRDRAPGLPRRADRPGRRDDRPGVSQMSEPAGTGSTAARNMDLLVGYVLIVGVLSSLGLLAAGLVWHWSSTGTRLDYDLAGTTVFGLVVTDFRQLAAGAWRPRLLVNLGLAVLLLTPYARVLASMLYFALVERNRKYAAFTTFVLLTLTYSLFLR